MLRNDTGLGRAPRSPPCLPRTQEPPNSKQHLSGADGQACAPRRPFRVSSAAHYVVSYVPRCESNLHRLNYCLCVIRIASRRIRVWIARKRRPVANRLLPGHGTFEGRSRGHRGAELLATASCYSGELRPHRQRPSMWSLKESRGSWVAHTSSLDPWRIRKSRVVFTRDAHRRSKGRARTAQQRLECVAFLVLCLKHEALGA